LGLYDSSHECIILKPGRQVDPRLEPSRVEEKTGKEKIWCDLVDPARLGQKPSYNPLIFIFLLKRHRFDFLSKSKP
jgi:hypothetical protein